MATSGNGSNTTLGFIVGALVVVVAGLCWFIFSGGEVPGALYSFIVIPITERCCRESFRDFYWR